MRAVAAHNGRLTELAGSTILTVVGRCISATVLCLRCIEGKLSGRII